MVFSLGLLASMTLPPLYLLPLLLAFTAFIFVLDILIESEASFWKCFGMGWWFGFGYFVFGLYWISYALTIDLAKFWWLIPFSVFGLPSLLAFFIAVPVGICSLLKLRGLSLALGFGVLWVISEWLRSFLFTGFPWNLMGYSWSFSDEMIQLGSLTGVYGLSLLSMLVVGGLYALFQHRWIWGGGLVCLMPLVWIFGFFRLETTPLETTEIMVRVVQPNIPQRNKWSPGERLSNLQKIFELSQRPTNDVPDIIVWPETAITFFLDNEPQVINALKSVIPPGSHLMTGAPRRTPEGQPLQIWNSILVFDSQGQEVGRYDKSHLVPFGEYMPFRQALDPYISLNKITAGSVDFSSGAGVETVATPHIPSWSGLVCYESIFPSEVVSKSAPRPEWLLNVTNDGWYGNSAGPYQHLEQSRMRSVEEGLPLVRAANTGISAVFDGCGRKVASLDLITEGVIDTRLPKPLAHVTVYGHYGNGVILGFLALIFFVALRIRNNNA